MAQRYSHPEGGWVEVSESFKDAVFNRAQSEGLTVSEAFSELARELKSPEPETVEPPTEDGE